MNPLRTCDTEHEKVLFAAAICPACALRDTLVNQVLALEERISKIASKESNNG